MDKTLREMIEVMESAERGEQIQATPRFSTAPAWVSVHNPAWNWVSYDFRVEPKPREWWAYVKGDNEQCTCAGHLYPDESMAKRMAGSGTNLIRVREVLE